MARAQQRIRRVIQTGVAFQANSQQIIQLPRNYDIETLAIRIAGSVTLPVALPVGSNGFKPAMRSDSPCGLVPRVEIIIEGRQTIFSVPFRILNRANVWRRRQFFDMAIPETFSQTQNPGLTKNAATASTAMVENTTLNFAAVAFVDMQFIQGLRPKDTVVRSGGLQTFDLRLTTSDSTGLFYQPGATLLTTPFSGPAVGATLGATLGAVAVLSNVTFDIFDVELEELRGKDDRLSVPGYVQRYTNQTINIPAVNAQQEILLPTDNFISAIIVAPTIGNEASDTLITNLIARRGTDQRVSLTDKQLIALNERDYSHQRFPGYYYLDFCTSGGVNTKITDAWNVQGGADTRLVLSTANPGANCAVDIVTCELMPVSPA